MLSGLQGRSAAGSYQGMGQPPPSGKWHASCTRHAYALSREASTTGSCERWTGPVDADMRHGACKQKHALHFCWPFAECEPACILHFALGPTLVLTQPSAGRLVRSTPAASWNSQGAG